MDGSAALGSPVPLDDEVLVQEVYLAVLRPGDVALDVGAGAGRHTLPMARSVGPEGRVHAFEPRYGPLWPALGDHQPDLAGRVVLHPGALGSFPSGPALRTIDGLFLGLPALRYLRVAAGGAELDVLRGASGCLRKFRPVIGFQGGGDPGLLARFLLEHGYALLDVRGRRLSAGQFALSSVTREVSDYVAVPAEDCAALEAALQVLGGSLVHILQARTALAAADGCAALVGRVPPLNRVPPWLRGPARVVARGLLFAGQLFLNPQRRYHAALSAALTPLLDGLCALERALHQSRRRVAELEDAVARMRNGEWGMRNEDRRPAA